MPEVSISPIGGPGQQFFDNNGNVLSGGLLTTYYAGTSTPLQTYDNYDGSTPNSNPIVFDSAGRVPNNGTWLLKGTAYKFVLMAADSSTVGTWDNISSENVPSQVLTDVTISGFNQTVHFGNTDTVQFNFGLTDLTSSFDIVNHYFIAPSSGPYNVSVSLDSRVPSNLGPTDSVTVMLYVNGTLTISVVLPTYHNGSISIFPQGSTSVYLSENNQLSVKLSNNTSQDLIIQGLTTTRLVISN